MLSFEILFLTLNNSGTNSSQFVWWMVAGLSFCNNFSKGLTPLLGALNGLSCI